MINEPISSMQNLITRTQNHSLLTRDTELTHVRCRSGAVDCMATMPLQTNLYSFNGVFITCSFFISLMRTMSQSWSHIRVSSLRKWNRNTRFKLTQSSEKIPKLIGILQKLNRTYLALCHSISSVGGEKSNKIFKGKIMKTTYTIYYTHYNCYKT